MFCWLGERGIFPGQQKGIDYSWVISLFGFWVFYAGSASCSISFFFYPLSVLGSISVDSQRRATLPGYGYGFLSRYQSDYV